MNTLFLTDKVTRSKFECAVKTSIRQQKLTATINKQKPKLCLFVSSQSQQIVGLSGTPYIDYPETRP